MVFVCGKKSLKKGNLFSVICFSKPQAANSNVLLGIMNNKLGKLVNTYDNAFCSSILKEVIENQKQLRISLTPSTLLISTSSPGASTFKLNLRNNETSVYDLNVSEKKESK